MCVMFQILSLHRYHQGVLGLIDGFVFLIGVCIGDGLPSVGVVDPLADGHVLVIGTAACGSGAVEVDVLIVGFDGDVLIIGL